MPVDLEMFLSHTGASLFDYPHYGEDRYSFVNSYEGDGFYRSISFPRSHVLIPKYPKKAPFLEKKKTLETFKTDNCSYSKNHKKKATDSGRKKKVSFADDKGYSLEEIREIPGSPGWQPSKPEPLLINDVPKATNIQKRWKLAFESPPWTDSRLIDLLKTNKVALESLKIKEKSNDELIKPKDKCYNRCWAVSKSASDSRDSEDHLKGTVKVKNLAYEKNVFIRITYDRWLSFKDIKANFLEPDQNSEKHYEFDTFEFMFNISPPSLKYEVIEFCVGYDCNGERYWDNNGGINYRLITEIVKKIDEPTSLPAKKKTDDQITLSLTENIEKFSEIDSWSNFIRNQPYW